jgi:hypothetical protein
MVLRSKQHEGDLYIDSHQSVKHNTWMCKYHVVFSPMYDEANRQAEVHIAFVKIGAAMPICADMMDTPACSDSGCSAYAFSCNQSVLSGQIGTGFLPATASLAYWEYFTSQR